MKKIIVSLLVLSLMLGVTLSAVAEEKKFKIGHAMAGLRAEWWVLMHNSILEEVKKYPEVELVWTDSEGKTEKQIADVNDLLLQDLDLLILFPNESAPLEAALDAAKKKNVPVIIWDKPMREGSGYLAFVAGAHYQIGKNDAEYCVKKLIEKYGEPKGKIGEIEGELGTLTTDLRRSGFDDEIAKYPNIKIVARDAAAWHQDKAYYLTKNFLQAHPDIDAFYYHNDNMALGGVKALEEEGKTGEIMTFGVDGDARYLKAIKDGKATATSTYSYVLGKAALEMGIKYLKGEKIPYTVTMPTYFVTKDNVDQFYKEGFPAYVEPENPDEPEIIWEKP